MKGNKMLFGICCWLWDVSIKARSTTFTPVVHDTLQCFSDASSVVSVWTQTQSFTSCLGRISLITMWTSNKTKQNPPFHCPSRRAFFHDQFMQKTHNSKDCISFLEHFQWTWWKRGNWSVVLIYGFVLRTRWCVCSQLKSETEHVQSSRVWTRIKMVSWRVERVGEHKAHGSKSTTKSRSPAMSGGSRCNRCPKSFSVTLLIMST